MPFEPRALHKGLIKDLDAFLQSVSLPDLYMAYAWKNDTYANGFPDIHCLECQLSKMDQTSGISLTNVKCVAKWGGMRNKGRIVGEDVVLQPHSLQTADRSPLTSLRNDPLTPLLALQENITKGIGPTYFSKVLRFALPQEYGAIDTRCVRVLVREMLEHQGIVGYHYMPAIMDMAGSYLKTKQAGLMSIENG